ncbi:MAG TPA: hypothetical protein VI815_03300 [Candidatus Nanoarchaeia archaeon]|nr:hypothetical protein [Candidatus Nanoarchaeia archaeon]
MIFKILIGVIIILVVASVFFGYSFFKDLNNGFSIGDNDIEPVKYCLMDSDCVKANLDCCGCSSGGKATVINKNFVNEYNDQISSECAEVSCIAVISDDPSCSDDVKPKCVNKKCELVLK